jgi:hypothetical protein
VLLEVKAAAGAQLACTGQRGLTFDMSGSWRRRRLPEAVRSMEGLEPTVGAALTDGNGKALSGCGPLNSCS